MATIELDKSNYETVINSNELVFVDFWAPWCGPCRAFGPVYEKVSEKYSDIKFTKVNTEEQIELAQNFQIRSIPTLMIVKNKQIVFFQPGMLPESALDELATKARELKV